MERLERSDMTRPMRFETWLNGKRMFASNEEPPAEVVKMMQKAGYKVRRNKCNT